MNCFDLKGSFKMTTKDWKASLESKDTFNDFITDYFKDHKQLTGDYETPSYYEYYTVTPNSKKGLVITMTVLLPAFLTPRFQPSHSKTLRSFLSKNFVNSFFTRSSQICIHPWLMSFKQWQAFPVIPNKFLDQLIFRRFQLDHMKFPKKAESKVNTFGPTFFR